MLKERVESLVRNAEEAIELQNEVQALALASEAVGIAEAVLDTLSLMGASTEEISELHTMSERLRNFALVEILNYYGRY